MAGRVSLTRYLPAIGRLGRILLAGIAVVASGIFAYVEMFSQFQYYDDEGYLMASVKSFMDGRPLFDETFSLYGPFYFLAAKLVYVVSGLSVSHDVTRLATIVLWMATGAVAAAFLYRTTSSFGWAFAGYLQTIVLCRSLCNEPGHPQALLVFLSMSVLLIAALPGPTVSGTTLLGIVGASVLLTKLNVGVYTLGALTVVYLGLTGPTRISRAGLLAAGVAAALLPFVVMRGADWAEHYARISALALTACCVTIARADVQGRLPASRLVAFFTSISVTIVVLLLLTFVSGTSLTSLLPGTFIAPLSFTGVYSVPWRLPLSGVIGGGASLAAALIVAWLPSAHRAPVGIALKLVFGVLIFETLRNSPTQMMSVAPLVWVVMLPSRPEPWPVEMLFPRAVVTLCAASHLLIGYPVGGSQQYWATLLLVPAAIVGVADAVSPLAARWRAPLRLPAEAAFVVLVVLFFYPRFGAQQLRDRVDRYRARVSLALPGANRIRLSTEEVQLYRTVTSAIERNCDTFVSMPGFNSFYFWTRQNPPTGLNAGAWMTLFDDRTQQRIVDRLAEHESACVIYNPVVTEEWVQGRNIERGPLVRYIRGSFHTVQTIGDFELMVRNERVWRSGL